MICQSCGEKEAVIHLKKVINGKTEEIDLCADCAKKENSWNLKVPFSFGDIFGGLLGYEALEEKQELVCPNCNTSYGKFMKKGKFGCPSCYEVFNDELSPIFKSIHGHDEHVGKLPLHGSERIKKKREIEKFRLELKNSISEERYEDAAKYRDIIRKLETELLDIEDSKNK